MVIYLQRNNGKTTLSFHRKQRNLQHKVIRKPDYENHEYEVPNYIKILTKTE
jgi:hypothetical protein